MDQLQRLGVRASICNQSFERYVVSLVRAVDSSALRAVFAELGIPAQLTPRVLSNLPLVLDARATERRMQHLLAQIAAAGGRATAVPHSFQRFGLIVREIRDAPTAVRTLVSFGDLSQAAAEAAVGERRGTSVGSFTHTTARWVQCLLERQGARVSLEFL